MPILFLSHSASDTEAARALKQRIEDSPAAKEAGLKVWFDKDDLRAGYTWQKQLAEAIEQQADAFAVLVGARGVVNWVEAEVELAISRAAKFPDFPFISIIAKESKGSSALPAFARRYQGVSDPLNEPGELSKLIKAATGGDWDRQVILTDEPFVGLRSMDESWANRFFGRKLEVGALVEKFKKHRLVAIVADSGAGKSSLAQAGLIPAFRGGALADESRDEPGDKIWHVVVMRPGSDPVQGLKDGITDAANLLGIPEADQSRLRSQLNISDVGESAYALRCDLDRKRTETLLIIDQFEELLIQTPEVKRAPFVNFLCDLTDRPFGFRILLTLRADYFAFDDPLQRLRSRLWGDGQDAVFRLKRMSDQALAETARGPLALVGFRDQAAVDALIQAIQRDVSDREGDLALVQMALHSVWRRHQNQSEDLLQAYAEVQGISGALAYEAEKVRDKLNDAQKALLFPILVRLIRRGELGGATRRVAQRDEFDAEKQKLIRHLSSEDGGRLLLAGDNSVEIAHEALITRWPWLRTEGQKFASDIEELSRLMDKAKAWAKEPIGDRPKYLAMGADLEAFTALATRRKDWLSKKEHEFVDASKVAFDAEEDRKANQAARLRWLLVALGIFSICLAFALIFLRFTNGQLEQRTTEALENLGTARQNLSSALTALAFAKAEQRPVDAAKFALAAWPRPGAMDLPKRGVTLRALSRSLDALHERMRIITNDTIYSVAFSPDGARVLTGSSDNTARLWDASTGEAIRTFKGHEGPVKSVAFSSDGTRVLTGSDDKTARLWDSATGKEIHAFKGHEDDVRSVAFSPDGRRVLTGSWDTTARLWDSATGEQIRVFEDQGNFFHQVFSVAFSPDGARILTGSFDGTARLWDTATGKEIRAFEAKAFVFSVAFSPNGAYVLTGSPDQTARLWDTATGEAIRPFNGHEGFVISVAFSPDGKLVLTGSSDNTARLWDATTGKEIRAFRGHEGPVTSVAFSPDGKLVLTGSSDNTARLWDATTGKEIHAGDGVSSVAFSPDGTSVLLSGDTTRLWDSATGKEIRTFEGHEQGANCVGFSPDGARVLTGSSDNTARLWDASTGEAIRTFKGHEGPVMSVAFSSDGTRALTGSVDKTARLWDSATGKEIQAFKGHEGVVSSVAISPDGKLVLAGSDDKTARLWNAETGNEIRAFRGHSRNVSSVAFSPDGRRVLTGSWDTTARLWDSATGKEIRAFEGHRHNIYSVAFNPDGARVLTGSYDRTARLWDASTGEAIRTFKGHEGPVMSVAFSSDGTRALTGSVDKTARIWDISGIPKGNIFDIVCAWLPDHDLSDLGKDHGLDLSNEAPICQKDETEKYKTILPD